MIDRVDEPRRRAVEGPAVSALYERVLAGRFNDETHEWLTQEFRKFERLDGALPLERCLGLPTSAERRRAERDYWLRAIATLVDQPVPKVRAEEVSDRLSAFMARGPWRTWRELSDPPESATKLEQALFHAARAIDDKPVPQWRQLLRVLDVVTEVSCNDNGSDLTSDS